MCHIYQYMLIMIKLYSIDEYNIALGKSDRMIIIKNTSRMLICTLLYYFYSLS